MGETTIEPSRIIVDVDWFMVAGIPLAVCWIAALVHCLTNKRLRDIERLTWVLVIIFFNFIGAIIYLIFGRNPKHDHPPLKK
ncbi:MAG TPA: PLD nuclease N-terminal domain-containing protein [Pirellulales bacterium]|jgi:uncharacterized membrane protein YhaH (DUF805 family)